MKSVVSIVKHSGRQRNKILFSVKLLGIYISPTTASIQNGNILSICFERGGKISASKNKVFNINDCEESPSSGYGDMVFFPLHEKVELVCTLFRNETSGKYEKKIGKIILRQLKKNNAFGVDSYKGIGMHCLDIDQLVNEAGAEKSPKSITFQMEINASTKEVINITAEYTVKMLQSNEETQETMSLKSIHSEESGPSSIIGATFEEEDRSVEKKSMIQKLLKGSGKLLRGNKNQHEKDQDDVNSLRDHHDNDEGGGDNGRDTTKDLYSDDEEEPFGTGREATDGPAVASSPYSRKTMKFLDENAIDAELQNGGVSTAIQKQSKANKAAFKLYIKELNKRAKKIIQLEKEMLNLSNSSRLEIQDLRAELNIAHAVLRVEKANYARLEQEHLNSVAKGAVNGMESNRLKKISNNDNDLSETLLLAKELAQTSTELQTANQELAYYRKLAEDAIQLKNEETAAAQDAATVAVKACLRRADLEQEIDELLAELIEMKMRQANMAIDLENEKKKSFSTKKKLQAYASQVATLEVAVSDAYSNLSSS